MNPQSPLLCLVGPTASGKSAVAYELGRRWGTELIMADSRQLYQGMEIGTDQPPKSWQATVAHHCVGLLPLDEACSAGQFCRLADPILMRLLGENKLPILVGGTGLYVRALLYGLSASPSGEQAVRQQLNAFATTHGANGLHGWLNRIDPESALAIDPADVAKVTRALEIFLLSGQSRTAWHRAQGVRASRYDHFLVGLRLPRLLLYERIEQRVRRMVKRGLIEEVRRLWAAGYDERCNAMRGLGYRQLLRAFRGGWSVEEAIEETIRETRRYAKRQMTWFRHQPGIQWLDLDGSERPDVVADRLSDMARGRWASIARCAIMAPVFAGG